MTKYLNKLTTSPLFPPTAIAILIRTFEKNLIDKDEALIKLQKLEVIARYSRAIMEDARERIEGGA